MNPMSLPALQAVFAQQTEEVFLACLTITHPDLTTPIRVVSDLVDHERATGTFIGCPFDITLPGSQDGQLPEVELSIDNVDPVILDSLRELDQDHDVTCTLEVVLASSLDTIESGPFEFTVQTPVSYDAVRIKAPLGFEDILNDRFPRDDFTPTNSPALF